MIGIAHNTEALIFTMANGMTDVSKVEPCSLPDNDLSDAFIELIRHESHRYVARAHVVGPIAT